MNIALCDDDSIELSEISRAVKELCPEAEILMFDSGSALINSNRKYDIVLLDIDMPENWMILMQLSYDTASLYYLL